MNKEHQKDCQRNNGGDMFFETSPCTCQPKCKNGYHLDCKCGEEKDPQNLVDEVLKNPVAYGKMVKHFRKVFEPISENTALEEGHPHENDSPDTRHPTQESQEWEKEFEIEFEDVLFTPKNSNRQIMINVTSRGIKNFIREQIALAERRERETIFAREINQTGERAEIILEKARQEGYEKGVEEACKGEFCKKSYDAGEIRHKEMGRRGALEKVRDRIKKELGSTYEGEEELVFRTTQKEILEIIDQELK